MVHESRLCRMLGKYGCCTLLEDVIGRNREESGVRLDLFEVRDCFRCGARELTLDLSLQYDIKFVRYPLIFDECVRCPFHRPRQEPC
jgi:hypothetical protein